MTVDKLAPFSPTPIVPRASVSISDLPKQIMLNIFSYLPHQAEWNACCRTSKEWKNINVGLRPLTELVNAIRNGQGDNIRKLLNEGVAVNLRIFGSKICPNVSYTPLICAQEYGLSGEIIELLKKHDQGFSEQFLKNRILSLQHDIDVNFIVNGCSFPGSGLDHLSHHHQLLPNMIASLKCFFDQFNGCSVNWDEKKTQRLLDALKMQPCISCSNDEALKKVCQALKTNELVIFSQSVNTHKHWVTFAALGSFIAIGNRGFGSGYKSGVMVYKITDKFTSQDIDSLFDKDGKPNPHNASPFCWLEQVKQKTGSCSRYSLEAGVLAGIFLLLNEKNNTGCYEKIIADKAHTINKYWWQFDQIKRVEDIIRSGNSFGYNLLILAHIYANFEFNPKTAEKLYYFLISTIKKSDGMEQVIPNKDDILLFLCHDCFIKGDVEKAIALIKLTINLETAVNS